MFVYYVFLEIVFVEKKTEKENMYTFTFISLFY